MKQSLFLSIFGTPLLLVGISVTGLLSALLGDGWWDAFSWITLATLPGVITYCWARSVQRTEHSACSADH